MDKIDIWTHIFKYLNINEILKLNINKEIYSIIDCQGWWKLMTMRDFKINNLNTDNHKKQYENEYNDKILLDKFTSDSFSEQIFDSIGHQLIKVDYSEVIYNKSIYNIEEDLESYLENFINKDVIKGIYVKNDSIGSIPKNIKYFVNLKRLIVEGSRLWYINLDNLPSCLEYLSLSGANTDFEDLQQLNSLKNLKYLEFDNALIYFSQYAFKEYIVDYNNTQQANIFISDQIILPFLKSLKSIKIGLCSNSNKINLCVLKQFFRNLLFNYPNYKDIIGDHNSYRLRLDKHTTKLEEDIYQDNYWNDYFIISL